jgi:hypothetical protein
MVLGMGLGVSAMSVTNEEALTVPCPTCKVSVGVMCVRTMDYVKRHYDYRTHTYIVIVQKFKGDECKRVHNDRRTNFRRLNLVRRRTAEVRSFRPQPVRFVIRETHRLALVEEHRQMYEWLERYHRIFEVDQ